MKDFTAISVTYLSLKLYWETHLYRFMKSSESSLMDKDYNETNDEQHNSQNHRGLMNLLQKTKTKTKTNKIKTM